MPNRKEIRDACEVMKKAMQVNGWGLKLSSTEDGEQLVQFVSKDMKKGHVIFCRKKGSFTVDGKVRR